MLLYTRVSLHYSGLTFSAVLSSGQLSFTVSIFQSYSILSNGYVPEVGLGQLVGHRQDGQRTVLFWTKWLINTTAVDQTPFSALNKHSAKQLLVILAVQLEGLREKRGQNHMETEENRISARFRPEVFNRGQVKMKVNI